MKECVSPVAHLGPSIWTAVADRVDGVCCPGLINGYSVILSKCIVQIALRMTTLLILKLHALPGFLICVVVRGDGRRPVNRLLQMPMIGDLDRSGESSQRECENKPCAKCDFGARHSLRISPQTVDCSVKPSVATLTSLTTRFVHLPFLVFS